MKNKQEGYKRRSPLIDYTSTSSEIGVGYFRNASCCFHDLFFKEANLIAMQAITLLVRTIFNYIWKYSNPCKKKLYTTTSSPNPQPAYVLTSAAGNLANTLGLHRNLDGLTLASEEIEQRRNVFWVFYVLEKQISRNLGRPSVINDDDIAVDLPPKKPETTKFPSRGKTYDIFQDQIKLSIIGSRIYTELYSSSSQTKSEPDRMRVLDKLDNHLQRWRDSIPIDIRPEHPISCSYEQYVLVAMMHLSYLDAVILLHRLPGHRESFENSKTNTKTNTSQLLCLAAARRSIQILDTFRNNKLQNLTWFVSTS